MRQTSSSTLSVYTSDAVDDTAVSRRSACFAAEILPDLKMLRLRALPAAVCVCVCVCVCMRMCLFVCARAYVCVRTFVREYLKRMV